MKALLEPETADADEAEVADVNIEEVAASEE